MKTIYYKCASCGEQVSILTNEGFNTMTIVAVHCPECIHKHQVSILQLEQLRTYLKHKEWEEIPIKRKDVIKMTPPQHTIAIFIPARRELHDYTEAMEIALRTVAAYEDRSVDDVLLEIIGGKVR